MPSDTGTKPEPRSKCRQLGPQPRSWWPSLCPCPQGTQNLNGGRTRPPEDQRIVSRDVESRCSTKVSLEIEPMQNVNVKITECVLFPKNDLSSS